MAEGTPYVILDGKIVSCDRCREKTVSRKGREIDLWYWGKKGSGGGIQGLFCPDDLPVWVSDVLPGNVHDLAAARESVLPVLRNYTGKMPGLADCGYEGAGDGVLTPVKKPKGVKELDINARTRNMLLSSARCLGERGFRAALPAVEDASARHREPRRDRPDRARSPCPGAIRAQAIHVKSLRKPQCRSVPGGVES